MAFTEFYVRTDGLDTNGGSSDAAAATTTLTDVTATHSAGGLHTLLVNSGTDFTTTVVGDWICWDTASAKERAIVTVKTDATHITVQNKTAAAAFTNLAGRAVKVGGAWLTIQNAVTLVNTGFVNAAGELPRVNIKAATYAETLSGFPTGTVAVPITYQGFTTTPGDGGVFTVATTA